MEISAECYYYPQMHAVECTVRIYDADTLVLPQDVTSLAVSLVQGQDVLGSTSDLDRFYANEDFAFRVIFSRPTANIQTLTISVTAELYNGDTSTAEFTIAEAAASGSNDDFEVNPLRNQPDNRPTRQDT